MSFGMKREEIEAKVIEELKKRPGGMELFNEHKREVIAKAIASVIVENNTKIQYSLGEAGVDFK